MINALKCWRSCGFFKKLFYIMSKKAEISVSKSETSCFGKLSKFQICCLLTLIAVFILSFLVGLFYTVCF